MPIQFQCPHCQHVMQLPDTAAGKQGKCPKCSKAVTVPAAGPAAPSNPHDEEFWSELDEEKETIPDEDEAPKPVKKSDAQILKKMLGKVEEAKKVKRIGLPWERPKEAGMFDRFWDTAIGVMNHTTETFAEMKVTGGIGAPFRLLLLGVIFGSLALAVYAAGAYAVVTFNELSAASLAAEEDGDGAVGIIVTPRMVIIGVAAFFGTFFGSIIGGIIHTFLQAAGLQLALPMAGVKESAFEKNFRIVAYTNGSIFLCNIIPFLGPAAMLFMWFNGLIRGIESVYEVSSNKAVLAALVVFVPLVLPIVAVVGFFAMKMLGYIE